MSRSLEPVRLILMYHRIAEVDHDVWGLSVEPDRFAAQIDALGRHAEIVPLAVLASEEVGPRAAVTFDDGYADNAEIAREILEAAGAPATVFVVAGMVGVQEFWWDRLARLVHGRTIRERVDLEIGRATLSVDLTGHEGRDAAVRAVAGELQGLPASDVERILGTLSAQLNGEEAAVGVHRILEPDALKSLASSSLIEVGSHTLSHPQLRSQSPEEQRREIFGSRQELEELTGTSVRSFAYPFGGFDEKTAALVEEAGYTCACANEPGHVTASTSPFQLPRYKCQNWSQDEFTDQLRSWFVD